MNIVYTIRLTESSPTRLKFSAWVPAWFLIILLLCFLFVGVLLTSTPHVECRWGPDGSLNCQIERTLLGMPISERTITGATAIGVGRLNWDDVGAGLIIQKGNSVIDVGGGGIGKKDQAAVDALDRFVREHRPGSTWAISLPCHPLLWAGYAFFLAVFAFAFCPTRVCLDKERDLLEVVSPGVGKSRRRRWRLSDVTAFALSQRYQGLEQDPPPWFEKHCPNFLAARQPTSDVTVLVLVARLKNGKEVGVLTNIVGGDRGLAFVRELERFRLAPLNSVGPNLKKPCAICGGECEGSPRLRDEQGAYFHPACYEARPAADAREAQ